MIRSTTKTERGRKRWDIRLNRLFNLGILLAPLRDQLHHVLLRKVRPTQFAHDLPVLHHDQPRADTEHLVDLRGDEGEAHPLRRQLEHQLLNLHLGAHIDPPCGFIQDQVHGVGEQPAGQDHLLLVAAGKGFDGRVQGRRLDIQELDILIGELFSLFAGQRLEKALQHLQGQDDIVPHGKFVDDPIHLAVLRQIADALFHGIQGRFDFHHLAVYAYFTACYFIRGKDGPHTFAAPRAQKPGKSVHLAFADGKVKGSHPSGAGKVLRREHRYTFVGLRRFVFLDGRNVAQRFTHHLGDELDLGKLRGGVFADQLTVTQHRDGVADLVNLIDKMGNEDDSYTPGL